MEVLLIEPRVKVNWQYCWDYLSKC